MVAAHFLQAILILFCPRRLLRGSFLMTGGLRRFWWTKIARNSRLNRIDRESEM
jgi:hypothetical protein